MTLDQVIASNVTRLRETKRWTMNDLADRLDVSRHDVLAYEGRRADRPQRPFRWSELVALCYVLKVTLFELVLPADSETEVREPALFPLQIVDVAGFGWPRSEELGYGLFGVAGDKLLKKEILKNFENWVQEETEKRTKSLQAVGELIDREMQRAAQVAREIDELRPGMTGRELLERYQGRTRSLPEILEIIRDEEEE